MTNAFETPLNYFEHLTSLQSEDGAVSRYLMESGAVGFCAKPVDFGSIETKTVSFFRPLLLLIMTINQRRN